MHGPSYIKKYTKLTYLEMRTLPLIMTLKEKKKLSQRCPEFGSRGSVSIYTAAVSNYHVFVNIIIYNSSLVISRQSFSR